MGDFDPIIHPRISRRAILQSAAAIGLGFSAAGQAPAAQANSKIGIGFIGVGGRGSELFRQFKKRAESGDTSFEIVAACDVWDKRTENCVSQTAGRARGYRDYQELLANPAVDAVVIATPDHWHSKQTIDAMRAGKDVYCEKPITLYWQQAKQVAQVERETGRVLQCGAGSASDGRWWTIRDIIKQGGIGPLIWAQGGAFRNEPGGDWNWPIQPCKPGEDLDWDQWLGHKYKLAPKRPYEAERYSRFRKYWDYSGGLATDLLYHTYSHIALAFDHEFPYRVISNGGQPIHNRRNDNREVPTLFMMQSDYADQCSCTLIGTQECEDSLDEVVRGQKAVITLDGQNIVVKPQRPFRQEMLDLANRLECYKTAAIVAHKEGDRTALDQIRVASKYEFDHIGNWLECIRTRKSPTLNAERAYRVMVPIALSVLSYRQGRAIFFDAEKQLIVDYNPIASRNGK